MLLIQGECLKALWLMLFPIVFFCRGFVRSDSAFCQVNGFFLSLAIETCDMAILLFTIHAALFYRKQPGGESGLAPYRRLTYAVAVLFPFLMASLAFMHGSPGYYNTGPTCYLSMTNPWYRQYLSWVPRYIIFVVIIVLTLGMCGYVCTQLGQASRRQSGETNANRLPNVRHYRRLSSRSADKDVADAAEIHRAPAPPDSRRGASGSLWPLCFRRLSLAISSPLRRKPETLEPPLPAWPQSFIGWDFQPSRRRLSQDSLRQSPKGTVVPEYFPPEPIPAYLPSSSRPTTSKEEKYIHCTLSTQHTGPLNPTPGVPHFSADVYDDWSGMAESRSRVRQQTLLQLLYPIGYVLTWIFPFIVHVLAFARSERQAGPLWLGALSTISLCTQGTMNCILFMSQEKPWRSVGTGFWESLCSRLRFRWRPEKTNGWSKEERRTDHRVARARRNAEARFEWMQAGTAREKTKKAVKFWWDEEGFARLRDGNEVRAEEQGGWSDSP